MPLDPRARRFLDLVAVVSRDGEGSEVEGMRRATATLAGFAEPPPPVERVAREVELPGRTLAARAYAPLGAAAAQLPGLVYFHGGGWVSGGLDSHDALCASLAALAGVRVVAIAYRLAPEHRFPAAHEDAREALIAVAAGAASWSIDPARLAVGGDSAGGNLAVYAARRAGVALRLLLLLSPVLQPLARAPSRLAFQNGYLITEATMARYWDLYRVEGLADDDPRVAPLLASGLGALPATRVHGAEFDPLRDEGEAFARAIAAAGGDARAVTHPGLIHHFYSLTGVIPSARAALAAVAADLKEGLATAAAV